MDLEFCSTVSDSLHSKILMGAGGRRTSVPSSEIQSDDQSGCLAVSSSSARPNVGKYLPITDIADLGTARLCTGQGQHWEEQVVARLKLGSCRRPEPIDLGLRRGQCFTVERGQTPDERIDKRVEVVIVQRAVHPAIALGDIGIEIVAAEDDLKGARAADQAREPFQRSAARDQSDADFGVAE